MFVEKHAPYLAEFVKLSQLGGSRADYVQGGGGNTSVKLEGGLMAIKASGFCLKDIGMDRGYAVLNSDAIRKFYLENQPDDFDDPEMAGAECTRSNICTVEGLQAYRPSVEAGFHSVLKKYVLHTHSVFANLAACTIGGWEVAKVAFANAPYSWGWVEYQDPGAKLAFAIRDELNRVEKETGRIPSVILMQNHGIIVHDDDAVSCLAIHADANVRLAAHFDLPENSFPRVKIRELAGGVYRADTPYLLRHLKDCPYTQEQLLYEPLYPDQMVFLVGTYFQDKDVIEEGEAVSSTRTGELLMRMSEKKAQALAETLTAIFFINEHVERSGYRVSTMSEAARNFIANWESEKYRSSLNEKK